MAFVKLIRLNDAGDPQGEVHVNPEHVVAVIGSETEPSVRVLTTSGELRVQQPPGTEEEPQPSVLSQLGG